MEIRFPLILDGATGTELQKRGYTGESCAEQWVLEHPETIREVQRGYLDAGSRVVYAPTFGANRQKLEERGIMNRTAEYNRRLPPSRRRPRRAAHGSRATSPRRGCFSPRSARRASRSW